MGSPEVKLRPLVPEDSPTLFRWRNSSAVARWMYTDHRISEDEHARWFAGAAADPARVYRVIEADGRLVGLVNLYDVDHRQHRCSWAYYLGEDDVRGAGVGAFVEYVTIEHVLNIMEFHKLWCEVLTDNEPVWKLHESFGFTREAVFRDHVLKMGGWTDVVGLGLLRDDWAQVREGCRERLERRGFDLNTSFSSATDSRYMIETATSGGYRTRRCATSRCRATAHTPTACPSTGCGSSSASSMWSDAHSCTAALSSRSEPTSRLSLQKSKALTSG